MLKKYYEEDLRRGAKQYNETIVGPVWYAAMKNEDDDDWGYGSFDIVEAVEMAIGFGTCAAYIAVISDKDDPVCEDTFQIDLDWEVTPMYAGDKKEVLAKDWICDKKAIDGVFEVMEVEEDGSRATVREVIFMEDPEDGRHDLDSAELTITAEEMKQMRHF